MFRNNHPKKTCSENVRKIKRETSAMEIFLSKVGILGFQL